MPGAYMTKMQAVAYIMTTIGVGRSVVMRAMAILEENGSIVFEAAPLDARVQRIRQEDVDKVMDFIKGNA